MSWSLWGLCVRLGWSCLPHGICCAWLMGCGYQASILEKTLQNTKLFGFVLMELFQKLLSAAKPNEGLKRPFKSLFPSLQEAGAHRLPTVGQL